MIFRRTAIHPSHYLWHEVHTTVFPKRLIDGTKSDGFGTLYRRRTRDGRWEYRQDPETQEERDARQW